MLGSVFYFVLNMSITAAFIMMFLLAVRAGFGRWIPKSAVYFLWGIVLLRLLVPVSIPSELSLLNVLRSSWTKTVALPNGSGSLSALTMLNSIQAADAYFPLVYQSDLVRTIFTVSGFLWIGGAAISVIVLVVFYNLTAAQLKKAKQISDHDVLERCKQRLRIGSNVWLFESGLVMTPIVVGILHPRIIIPQNIDQKSLEYALLHELAHIKRRDNFWKMVSVFAVCIHWFNPFAWLFLYLSDRDMELACDAKVLKSLKGEDKKCYAQALVNLAAKQQNALTAFGGTAIKRRILNIVSYKRVSLIMAVITAMICLTLIVLLLTNPVFGR